ncbi:MAG: FHA domain-containing protein [Ruminococcus sp.]|nr:FHA domain-containing protein [Ruminococcus sp.]
MKERNRQKSKIRTAVSIVLMILLLCSGSILPVLAESTLQIGIDQYEVMEEEGRILIYVNQNGDEAFSPSIADSTLFIGKNTLTIEDIKSLEEAGEPVTYLCLIDISGSMTEEGIEQTKAILRQFAEAKKADDNFCITTMGNDVTSSGFLTGSAELSEAIDGIARISTEDTNLYYSVTEAINVLKTDQNVHKKRCLLIFSDGEDDQKKGITEKEAEDAVKENHIPVFTVVLSGKNLNDAEGSAKILGSFARNSAGGEHYAPPFDTGCKYEDICEKVNKRLKSSLVITANLENIKEVGDDTVYIGVDLSDGTQKASDGITVPAGKILEAIEALEEARKSAEVTVTVIDNTEQAPAEEPEPVEEPAKLNKQIVIGIALLVLVLIIVIILLLSRRKSADEEEAEEEVYPVGTGSSLSGMGGGGWNGEKTIASTDTGAAVVPETVQNDTNKGKNRKDKVKVTLHQIGPGNAEVHQLVIKDKVTIGRNKTCQLALDNDTALSGKHCSILYRDNNIYVKDEESTNGTFINGVPIVGEYKVEMDDILLIGSFEYRITWE